MAPDLDPSPVGQHFELAGERRRFTKKRPREE
jgi:hypothetical protein